MGISTKVILTTSHIGSESNACSGIGQVISMIKVRYGYGTARLRYVRMGAGSVRYDRIRWAKVKVEKYG